MANSIDRFMLRLRGPIIGALYLSVPVFAISYGWMVKNMAETAPAWVTAVVVISHLLAWLGIASLFDRQQERRLQ